jgi:hypothetical protein
MLSEQAQKAWLARHQKHPAWKYVVVAGVALLTFPGCLLWVPVWWWLRQRGYGFFAALGAALGLLLAIAFLLILGTTVILLVTGTH